MTCANGAARAREYARMRYLRFGAYVIDLEQRELLQDGIPLSIPPATVDLIAYLVSRDGRVVSHGELADALWNDGEVEDNTIAQHVHLARTALRDLRKPHVFIQTVPRRGYRFGVI